MIADQLANLCVMPWQLQLGLAVVGIALILAIAGNQKRS
jgi:hypothetical protein